MMADGTRRCGVKGCNCKKFVLKESFVTTQTGQKIISTEPDRCVCGHTRINHIFNTSS